MFGEADGEDVSTLEERYTAYRSLLHALHESAVDAASPDATLSSAPRFLLHSPIAVIASPGRDRLMMGHVRHYAHFTS